MKRLLDRLERVRFNQYKGDGKIQLRLQEFLDEGIKIFSNDGAFYDHISEVTNVSRPTVFKSLPISVSGVISRIKKGQLFFTKNNLANIIDYSDEEEDLFIEYPTSTVTDYNSVTANWTDNSELQKFNDKINERIDMKLVKVIVTDNDPALNIDQSVVSIGEEVMVRDVNNAVAELSARGKLDLNKILTKHNEKRAKVLNVKASATMGRDVFLIPIEYHDLTVQIKSV